MIALFVLAVPVASWAPRIPQVRDRLALGNGQLGVALLGAPIGAVLTLWLVGRAVAWFGSTTMVRVALLAYCVTGTLLPLARGPWSLAAVLAPWGATSSCLDIAANAQAVGVERRYQRSIMTSVHASWTAGALLGAGLGSVAEALKVPLLVQLSVLGALGLGIALPATRWMLPDDDVVASGPGGDSGRSMTSPASPVSPASSAQNTDRSPPRRRFGSPSWSWMWRRSSGSRPGSTSLSWSWPFVALCILAFGSFFCEGVAADWSAVYLTDVTGAGAGSAGIGFVAFTSCMLVVRVVGDQLVGLFGPARTVRGLASVAVVGVVTALAVGSTPVGMIGGTVGFGTLGAGTACVLPTVFSAAGRIGASTATSIAVVSTIGYAGWLSGPPVIGGLAALAGLHLALVVVPVLLGMVAVLASALVAFFPSTACAAPLRREGTGPGPTERG